MYLLYLECERINKNPMYFHLTDVEQARDLAKTKKLALSDVIENHAKILENVLFKSRGNAYLPVTEKASDRL